MSDNDLDDDFDDENGGFEDFQSESGTLGDLWRNNPLVKIGTILGGLAVVVGGIIIFGGGGNTAAPSAVRPAAEVTEAPGSGEVSQTIIDAINERNTDATEEALRTQGSVLPMATEPQLDRLPDPVDKPDEEDPLERWRLLQAERQRVQQQAPPPPPPQQVDTGRQETVNQLANSMSDQMGAVLDAQKLGSMKTKQITGLEFLEQLRQKEEALEVAAAEAAAGDPEEEILEILVPAGKIEYAQLITEANTDAPGPVLAQIMSGRLRGSRVLGSFEATDEYLVLSFNTIVVDGIAQGANAVALDPAKANPGVITEIDRRYFQRIVLPAAAAFVEGLTSAISESGTTNVTVQGETVSNESQPKDNDQEVASGIAEAGQEIRSILEEENDKVKPLLRVAAGTPVGILFLEPVLENE